MEFFLPFLDMVTYHNETCRVRLYVTGVITDYCYYLFILENPSSNVILNIDYSD